MFIISSHLFGAQNDQRYEQLKQQAVNLQERSATIISELTTFMQQYQTSTDHEKLEQQERVKLVEWKEKQQQINQDFSNLREDITQSLTTLTQEQQHVLFKLLSKRQAEVGLISSMLSKFH